MKYISLAALLAISIRLAGQSLNSVVSDHVFIVTDFDLDPIAISSDGGLSYYGILEFKSDYTLSLHLSTRPTKSSIKGEAALMTGNWSIVDEVLAYIIDGGDLVTAVRYDDYSQNLITDSSVLKNLGKRDIPTPKPSKKELEEQRKAEEEARKAEEEARKAEEERLKKFEAQISLGDSHFAAGQYNLAKLQYIDAKELDDGYTAQEKINMCEEAICQVLLNKGDSLYRVNQFDDALLVFKEGGNCSTAKTFEERIKKTEKTILDNKIQSIRVQAETSFAEKHYALAKEQYESILKLNNSDTDAKNKIGQLEELINILSKRSTTTLTYENSNKAEFIDFRNGLIKNINQRISENQDGFLKFNYTISFDTLGKNLSAPESISTSMSDYPAYLSSIAENGTLKPYSEKGYFINTRATMNVEIDWKTSLATYTSKYAQIATDERSGQKRNEITDFIHRQSHQYGKFQFEIKDKNLNGRSYSDIKLIDHRTVGPEAALLSMLMPGMGTLKATYGNKGWKRLTYFLISSSIAVGAELYSRNQYQQYLNATNLKDIDSYYNLANRSHQVSLICGGISAGIYITDVVWVFARGCQNLKKSKVLKNQLKQGPVEVINQALKFE
jgi:tetratricopeptide (TPR) repeat protein